jgi:hypothetical protein
MKHTAKKFITSSATILTLFGALGSPLAVFASTPISSSGSANISISESPNSSGDTTYSLSDAQIISVLQKNTSAYSSYQAYLNTQSTAVTTTTSGSAIRESLASKTYGVTKIVTHSWGFTIYLNSYWAGWAKYAGGAAVAALIGGLASTFSTPVGGAVVAVAGYALSTYVSGVNTSHGVWASFDWFTNPRGHGQQ